MIKAFKDYETTQAASTNGAGGFPKLPAGGYEAVVMGVKISKNSDGSERLDIMVDIAVGEFKDYFKKKYDSSTFADKKYGGIVRYSIPTDDGSEKDKYKKSFFKGMITAFEASNPKFKWSWDEQKLKGLKVGIYVRDKEYDWNGKHGFAPEVFAVGDIGVIQRGEFDIPKPKYLNGDAPSAPTNDYPPLVENPEPAPMPANDDYPF